MYRSLSFSFRRSYFDKVVFCSEGVHPKDKFVMFSRTNCFFDIYLIKETPGNSYPFFIFYIKFSRFSAFSGQQLIKTLCIFYTDFPEKTFAYIFRYNETVLSHIFFYIMILHLYFFCKTVTVDLSTFKWYYIWKRGYYHGKAKRDKFTVSACRRRDL